MKTTGVTQLTVRTSLEAEEPVAALLERIFGETPSSYSNMEKQESTVSLFTRVAGSELRKHIPEIEAGFKVIGECGLRIEPAEIRISKVRREDWSESWKKYFKTIQVGRALIIKPSWSKHKPLKGQAVVVLDPGLSFGTGQHATTSFCLREIVAQKRRHPKASLLDMGCGSGILAISAAKLGYRPVDAFDFDRVAVRVAKKNCATNRVTARVNVARRDLVKMPKKSSARYDVVCANLMSNLLIEQRDKILARVGEGGVVVLAGILAIEFENVRQEYEAAGFKLRRTRIEREWQSGAFSR